jgi:signal-transduction protein with cAMP-binding, CBS, and nucleotidyltransferase domain
VETQNRANEHALGLHGAAFAKLLALLPLANYRAGETVLTAGSKSGRLLILKSGAVVILKDSIEIARVEESGAVFGELSALLALQLHFCFEMGAACFGLVSSSPE